MLGSVPLSVPFAKQLAAFFGGVPGRKKRGTSLRFCLLLGVPGLPDVGYFWGVRGVLGGVPDGKNEGK